MGNDTSLMPLGVVAMGQRFHFITQGSVPFSSYQMVQRLGRVLSRPRLLPQGQAQG